MLPRVSEILPIDWQGKSVLLFSDQGIGDELFFLRYLPQLQALGAKTYYLPSVKLYPLLERLNITTLLKPDTKSQATQYPSVDYTFAVSDLPLMVGTKTVENISPSADAANQRTNRSATAATGMRGSGTTRG